MPIYAYHCDDCEKDFDRFLKVADYDQPQKCEHCNSENTQKKVVMTNFNLPGDGWASKNLRIKDQMRKKNEKLKAKEKERWGGKVTLAPNVDGERVESWKDAKSLAKSKGKDTTSYDKKIQKENSSK